MKLEEIMGLRLGRKQVPWGRGFMGSWASHVAEVDRDVLGKFCGQEMHNFTIFTGQGQVLPPVGQGENQDLETSC